MFFCVCGSFFHVVTAFLALHVSSSVLHVTLHAFSVGRMALFTIISLGFVLLSDLRVAASSYPLLSTFLIVFDFFNFWFFFSVVLGFCSLFLVLVFSFQFFLVFVCFFVFFFVVLFGFECFTFFCF